MLGLRSFIASEAEGYILLIPRREIVVEKVRIVKPERLAAKRNVRCIVVVEVFADSIDDGDEMG